jgi:high-affinity nickel-transport protein
LLRARQMTLAALPLGRRVAGLCAILIIANLAVWGWALALFHGHAVLLATALLAYGFGLRHAVDADHIAAIDNVTRKLMHDGQRPIGVGGFFALGHSTVVIVAATAIAATAGTLQARFPGLVEMGGTIGTAVSASFLLAIALVNAMVLIAVYRRLRQARRGSAAGEDFDVGFGQRGLLARVFRRLFRMISRSWHMYPLGLLFGLGFDTASEIGLLGIAAAEAANGLPIWSILVFPALFTAGMSLVDATDGILMLGAYGWAFVDPARKLFYNLAITGLSVAVALLVGGIEAFGLVSEKLGLAGGIWGTLGDVSANISLLGYAIIAIFVLSWLVSWLLYRLSPTASSVRNTAQ